MKRYLITTADERTWKFDRPVLFLGEWCRRYNRRHIWNTMDAVVAEPYGVRPDHRTRDLHRVGTLTRAVNAQLTRVLNAVHQTRHSERYWSIVLGHWLLRAVGVLFNRYHVLEQALAAHEVDGTTVLDTGDFSLANTDSLAFIYSTDNDLWNHVLNSRLIADRGDVPVEPVALRAVAERPASEVAPPSLRDRVLLGTVRALAALSRPFVRDSDAVIVNSYLSTKTEILLQLSLGQVPQLWPWPSFEETPRNAELRTQLVLDETGSTEVHRAILRHLPELMPTCFLEGYTTVRRAAEALPWPKRPKFIFTSNNFDTDEVFKVGTAERVEQGTPYFTGQHGANYGTRAGTEYWPERTTADTFFTWGWQDDGGISVPAFVFKRAKRDARRYAPEGGVLLIEDCLYHACFPWDRYYEFGLYQEAQFRFVERLPPHIHQRLTVRLHGGFRLVPWSDDERWRDRSPETQLDLGTQPVSRLIAKSRVVVHSYDSTGILETLSSNIPTVCFWRQPLDHLTLAARPYYELLRGAGMLFDGPEEAADAVASRWDGCDAWWHGPQVQEARLAFCRRYARPGSRRVRTMRRLLRAACKSHRQRAAR